MWIYFIEDGLPEKRDSYYLFGGYDHYGTFSYDKFHINTEGLVNGWSVASLIRRGYSHWCDVPAPHEENLSQTLP